MKSYQMVFQTNMGSKLISHLKCVKISYSLFSLKEYSMFLKLRQSLTAKTRITWFRSFQIFQNSLLSICKKKGLYIHLNWEYRVNLEKLSKKKLICLAENCICTASETTNQERQQNFIYKRLKKLTLIELMN